MGMGTNQKLLKWTVPQGGRLSVGDPIACWGNDQMKGSTFDSSSHGRHFPIPETPQCCDDIAMAYMKMVVVAEMELDMMGNPGVYQCRSSCAFYLQRVENAITKHRE